MELTRNPEHLNHSLALIGHEVKRKRKKAPEYEIEKQTKIIKKKKRRKSNLVQPVDEIQNNPISFEFALRDVDNVAYQECWVQLFAEIDEELFNLGDVIQQDTVVLTDQDEDTQPRIQQK